MLLAFLSLFLILELIIIKRGTKFKLTNWPFFWIKLTDISAIIPEVVKKKILSIRQCLKPYTSPNIENHMHIENVNKRGKVFMYKKNLDFNLPSCCMNIPILQPQRPHCVCFILSLWSEYKPKWINAMHCI